MTAPMAIPAKRNALPHHKESHLIIYHHTSRKARSGPFNNRQQSLLHEFKLGPSRAKQQSVQSKNP
jgi:hypothetical protein